MKKNQARWFEKQLVKCPLCLSHKIAKREFQLSVKKRKLCWSRCSNCSLVFQNPRLKENYIRKLYREINYWGSKKDGISAYSEYEKWDFLRLDQGNTRLAAIQKTTGLTKGKILDVGCATGFFCAVAQTKGFQVMGIEPSNKMASYGRTRYKVNIINSTLEKTSIPSKYFDLITLWGTDSHFLDPLQGFSKISDALKSGGYLAMTYQNFDHPIRLILPQIKKNWNVMFNLTDKSFALLMKKIGLKILKIKTEWQRVPFSHLLHQLKISNQLNLIDFPIVCPALSYRFVILRKK